MQSTTLKPPHGWVGGKSRLAKDIVEQIPDDHGLYVEVFGGALNILYAKKKPTSPKIREVINDINGELINLHRQIQKRPQTLSLYLKQLLVSRDIFYDILKRKWVPRNDMQRAAFYYYLLTQSFGAKGLNFAMNAKSRRPRNLVRDFSVWSRRLEHVTIENRSFEEIIKNYDKAETFFYCDPPYVETESYYQNTGGFGFKEHQKLAKLLFTCKGRFLLSYNDHPLVRELYKDFTITSTKKIEYTLGKNTSGKDKKVREVLIRNY